MSCHSTERRKKCFTLMRGAFFLTQATLVTKAQPQGDAHR
jgi:hypothetical protein